MDCGGRDTVLQDAYDIDSLVISIETIKRQASSLKCSPVTSGPSEPRRDTKVLIQAENLPPNRYLQVSETFQGFSVFRQGHICGVALTFSLDHRNFSPLIL